jgi:hypothetical protein
MMAYPMPSEDFFQNLRGLTIHDNATKQYTTVVTAIITQLTLPVIQP